MISCWECGVRASLVGGTGFLVVGGPRRVVRYVARRVLPQPRPDPNAGILPDEERAVSTVSEAIEHDPDLTDELRVRFSGSAMTSRRIELAGLEDEMEAIPRIRRPKDVHTTDQIVRS